MRIDSVFDELIKEVSLASLKLVDASLESQDDDNKSWFFF